MPNWKKVIISGSDAALNSLEITSDLTLGVDGTGGNLTAHSNTAGRALTWNKVTSALNLADNSAMKFGTGGDFNIAHNGSNTVFTCINGNVSFINYADDQDISFTIDQGGTTHQLMTLDGSANSVGIGTTTPSAKLNVKGIGTTSTTTALLVEDSSGADLLEVNDLGNVAIPNGSLSLNGATDVENFNMVGTMFFDGSGTIAAGGVGDKLVLQAQSANIAIGYPNAADITMTGGVTGSFSGSFEGDGSNLTGITAEWDGSHNGDAEITGSLVISGSSADLTVTRRVGVGVTSPSYPLHVDGQGLFGVDFANGWYLNPSNLSIYAGGNQTITKSAASLILGSSSYTAFIVSTSAGYTIRTDSNGQVNIGSSAPTAKLQVVGRGTTSTTTALLVENSSGTDLLKVRDDGNVGIGTSSPLAKLQVAGNVLIDSGEYISWGTAGATSIEGSTASNKLQFRTNSSDSMIIDSAGNVGIGTTSPGALLQLEKPSQDNILAVIGQTGYEGALFLSGAGSGKDANIVVGNGRNLEFHTSTSATPVVGGTERMRITSTGNVGIGTSSPGAKLDVVGDINITAANISNQVNADVDIGTETVATVPIATYTAAFFDYVVKGGLNVRAGVVHACHDGTSVQYIETSTLDLGNTLDLQLSVDISGTDMRLRATATSNDWSVKTITRAL